MDPFNTLKSRVKRFEFPSDVFPPHWKDRSTIEEAIIKSSAKVNVTLVRHTVDPHARYSKKKTNKCPIIVFKCDEGVPYKATKKTDEVGKVGNSLRKDGIMLSKLCNPNRNRKKQARTDPKRSRSSKPSKDSLCPHTIRLSLDPGNCWFIQPGNGYVWHNHLERLPHEKRHRTSTLSPEEKKLAASIARHGGCAAATAVLSDETNMTFSHSQLDHLKKNHEIDTGHVLPKKKTHVGGGVIGETSDADELIRHLEKERDEGRLSFVALCHEVKESTLQTVRKADERRWNKIQQEHAKTNKEVVSAVDTGDNDDNDDDTNTPKTIVNLNATAPDGTDCSVELAISDEESLDLGEILSPIQEQLRVGQRILLACAWARDDERRLFELYPEVLSVDVTFGTNREGRPLGTSCSFDQNMKTFTPVRAFLPSECGWVFRWLFETAVPALIPESTRNRIQLVLTDGDAKMCNAFNLVQPNFYPNAIHGLCMFHLVSQPLSKLPLMDADKAAVKGMVLTFKLWIYSWMSIDGVETEEEYQQSLSDLRRWLKTYAKEDECLRCNGRKLEEFLTTKILVHKERWFLPGRQGRMTFDQKATSALESVHRVMKNKKGVSVAPNMSLLSSFLTQQQQVDRRMAEHKVVAAEEARGRSLFSYSPTANVVTKSCETQVMQQREQGGHYCCRVCSDDKFQLRRSPGSASFCQECERAKSGGLVCCDTHCVTSPIARHQRVRAVEAQDLGNGQYEIVCSCPYFGVFGIPCRHVMVLLGDAQPSHVHIRWHKAQAAYFKDERCPDVTKAFCQRCNDHRLVVEGFEYMMMIRNAKQRELLMEDAPDDYWDKPSIVVNQSIHGMVPAHEDTEDDRNRFVHGNEALLSTEVCLSQELEEDGDEDAKRTGI